MAVYSVEGKLGTGKTKFAVWRAKLALMEGRRVASNVDLYLHKLLPQRKYTYTRIPDHPTPWDLDAIGHGNPESYDEDRNGILILDELGTWLNTRSFQDKSRAGIIDWLIHARKLGWDVYLIVQHADMIDKQVRSALLEYQARCVRLDKVKIPLIGGFLHAIGGKRWGYLPRMHCVTARIGEGQVIVAERWIYRGDDLHSGYDTRQVFKADYPHASHSVLPPWDHKVQRGRFAEFLLGLKAWLEAFATRPVVEPRAKRPEVAAAMALDADRRIPHLNRLKIALDK